MTKIFSSSLRCRLPVLVAIFEVLLLVLYAVFVTYDDSTNAARQTNQTDPLQNSVYHVYPFFVDVQVMIFIGFGCLLAFMKRYGFGGMVFNFLTATFAIQWAVIVQGFFQFYHDGKIHVGVFNLLNAEFACAVVLISFGAILGRTSPIQLLVMALLEVPIFAVTEWAILKYLKINDAGTVSAQEQDEDVAPDSTVEEEEEDEEEDEEAVTDEASVTETENEDLQDDPAAAEATSHPDADTTIVFVTGEEFPANQIVKFLVGLTNKGSEDFTVQSLEASFRYPQDFQFYIQNFTALPLSTVVQPEKQATFEYSFIPAEPMAGRPFGLVIELHYQDSNGNVYQDAVFNQTVTIVELDQGLDGETVFLYVFLTGLVMLVLVGIYQVLESRTRKRSAVKVETGSGTMNDVDISWIPQETLNVMNRASPKASPRKRTKRAAGTDQ
ncbi:UNVERIFIED_CONTAM: hypothetical protein FKN15_046533 [Acipenser sinensis]